MLPVNIPCPWDGSVRMVCHEHMLCKLGATDEQLDREWKRVRAELTDLGELSSTRQGQKTPFATLKCSDLKEK